MKEKIVRSVAGTFVLTSIILAFYVNIAWLWLGVFVGVNLYNLPSQAFAHWKKY